MGVLETAVTSAFSLAGPLARAQAGWRARPGQLDMAQAVARAIESGGSLAVEAGTGIGKTFAYLIPLLLSGRRALLSTATQTLQEQLFSRDIPAVAKALGFPVRVALLKGRSSYVCLHRLEQAIHGPASRALRDPAVTAGLWQAWHWATQSLSGDLAELTGLGERSPMRSLMTSTRDNCMGSSCPRLANCHVNRARREAMQAEWVVVNHHVFFADQLLQESDAADFLPWADVVVFDEAHRLNDTGIAMQGRSLASGGLREFARDVALNGPQWARGQRPWGHLALALEQAVGQLATVPRRSATGAARCRWVGVVPDGVEPLGWERGVAQLGLALAACNEALESCATAAVELQRLRVRVHALQKLWQEIATPAIAQASAVRWVEWSDASDWQVVCAPTDSARLFRRLLAQAPRSWVFTSATLGIDEHLTWFKRGLGLESAAGMATLRVPSSFDHVMQAAMYIPQDLPDPSEASHTPELALSVARWASRLGGRTLVLTTTLKAAARMAQSLQIEVAHGRSAQLQVLVQGRQSRRALLARFRDATGLCVLIASASFWEGVDLAGDALQLLVIDKLPFATPDDPILHARGEQLEALGLSAFREVVLPEAAMALKQGAGRLIRSESDRGILVIGDRRLLSRSYGNAMLAALPDMRQLVDESEMASAIDDLVVTRSSTKARQST